MIEIQKNERGCVKPGWDVVVLSSAITAQTGSERLNRRGRVEYAALGVTKREALRLKALLESRVTGEDENGWPIFSRGQLRPLDELKLDSLDGWRGCVNSPGDVGGWISDGHTALNVFVMKPARFEKLLSACDAEGRRFASAKVAETIRERIGAESSDVTMLGYGECMHVPLLHIRAYGTVVYFDARKVSLAIRATGATSFRYAMSDSDGRADQGSLIGYRNGTAVFVVMSFSHENSSVWPDVWRENEL